MVIPAQTEGQDPSPGRALFGQLFGDIRLRLIHVVTLLNIADHIAEGNHGVDALAELTGTRADLLYRVMRALAGEGIFRETEDRQFVLTPQAEYLRADREGSLRDFILYLGSDWHYQAWEALPNTLRGGEPSFDLAFGEPLFEHLQKNPERAAVYNRVQHSNSVVTARSVPRSYDFSKFRTVMDVGGGHGLLMVEILRSAPGLTGILFDMPAVSQRNLLEDSGVADRCTVIEGSFFGPLPGGADAIVLKNIIHDWDDEQARRILANCRAALKPGGKILVCEVLLPARNEPGLVNLIDLEMLAMSGGQERTEQQYRSLFEGAGLRLGAVYPAAVGMSILEAEPKG